MQNINLEDLKRIRTHGYKIAYILPELDNNQSRYCKTFLANIYKKLFNEGESGIIFDAEKQIITAKINGERKTLLLAHDYSEQDKLLKYSFDIVRSLNRLAGDEQKLDILKVMPNGNVIDANLVPLCRIKDMSPMDSAKLYCGLIDRLNSKNDFVFSAVLDKDGLTTIFFSKGYSTRSFSLDNMQSVQENRCARAMRMFYGEAINLYDFSFFMNENVIFLDEIGDVKKNDILFSLERREKMNKRENVQLFNTELTADDFYAIDLPSDMAVFALKEYGKRQEKNLLNSVRVSLSKAKIDKDKLSMSCVNLDGKDYLAILCAKEDVEVLNARASVMYAKMRENRFYMNDDKMFYYLDARGQVTPLSHTYLCRTKISKNNHDRLAVVLEHSMGSAKGHEVVTVTTDGVTDCFLKVIDDECCSAQSYSKLMEKKQSALKNVVKSFRKDIELLQNDGAPMPQTDVNRITNSATRSVAEKS